MLCRFVTYCYRANIKYYRRWELSEAKFRHSVRCFSLDLLAATETAQLTGLSLRSVTVIFNKLCRKLARWSEQLAPIQGIMEADEP